MKARATLMVAAACLSLAATGCIIAPNDGDSIADRHLDTFDFEGWATAPLQRVRIQARNGDGVWVTIAQATSARSGWLWQGVRWYYWSVDDVQVPVHGNYWRSTEHLDFHHECEVRAVDANGFLLFTFEHGFSSEYDYDEIYDMTIDELGAAAAHGTTMTLYSDN